MGTWDSIKAPFSALVLFMNNDFKSAVVGRIRRGGDRRTLRSDCSKAKHFAPRINMRVLIFFLMAACSQVIASEDEYTNPVDGKTYVADWKTYQPKDGVKPPDGRVINSGVRLLSTQADFERNTTAEDLAKLIGFIQDSLEEQTEGYEDGGEILLQIELHKENNPEFKMSYRGEISEKYLQGFYNSLESIEFRTQQSTVTLQVHFVVKNA